MLKIPGADDVKKAERHMTSAAAFVEGGVQEARDDSCSICLEAFCESDPSTVKEIYNLLSFGFCGIFALNHLY